MYKKLSAFVFVAFLVFTSTNAYAFKVVGYFMSWGPTGSEETIRYDYVTHIKLCVCFADSKRWDHHDIQQHEPIDPPGSTCSCQ